MSGGGPTTHAAIDGVWRTEAARVVASLARMTGDVGRAEDLAQDALLAALEQWPSEGVPGNPGAWLTATAKHRAVDGFRRDETLRRKVQQLGHESDHHHEPDLDAAMDDDIGDELLSLIFTACHPVLAKEARIALTLRLIGALTTAEIARAFLVPEATVAQRIVRAKKTLAAKQVAIETPRGADRDDRLASVLEVVYAVFNEGYAATTGDDLIRPELCTDAVRLGRLLVGLAPDEPEVHGLLALMEIQASRQAARTTPDGEIVLLLDQDRSRWDGLLIRRGLDALERAESLAAGAPGSYALQAAIAACHARAGEAADTDWTRIASLYGALAVRTGSPVVELNRAVAVGMADGPAAGLEVLDGLAGNPALAGYHLLHTARGDLLEKLGRGEEARAEFQRAAAMTANDRERGMLERRAAEAVQAATGSGAGAGSGSGKRPM